jgi:hypothetical protein
LTSPDFTPDTHHDIQGTVARHFNHRFETVLKAIIDCPDYLGEVQDYFWRVEFQVRLQSDTHVQSSSPPPPRLV